ncbi:fluoride efflux transporter CrcB [Phenylobacterium sp.]|uniref:fluoride efflux transporter CrcB n=1 Tax=Phenylobacterium sp. TaxID=1871053 RepID=UPI003001C228
MDKLILIAIGGGGGAVMRYLLGVASFHRFGSAWPVGTFLANVSGGLLMGLLVGWLAQRGGADQERLRLLLGVGLLGGFTTFSAFSLETALMIERRAYGEALGYALVSVLLSVTALFVGLMLMRRFA